MSPTGVIVDLKGNIYIADNNWIRKIDSQKNVSTVAGSGTQPGNPFTTPFGVATDKVGNIYIVDTGKNRITPQL